MSINKYIVIQIIVLTYNGVLLSNIKEWTTDVWNNMGDSQTVFAEWKKTDKKSVHCLIHFT